MRPPLFAVVGPTAVGKSERALQLAERWDGEIVTVDSAQVFKRLDIGTAKPSLADRERRPHHLIDLVEPDDRLDAAHYAELANTAIEDIRARGRVPIMVGGTGLWLRALVRGIFNVPEIDAELRRQLREEIKRRGPVPLHQELAEVDPIAASRIKSTDPQRITRALEVFRQTGVPISTLQAEHGFAEDRHRLVGVVLDRPRLEVWDRIALRSCQMYERGLLDETEAALASGVAPDSPGLSIIGYRDAVSLIRGEVDQEEALRRTVIATRRYAKRQRNWFRSEPRLMWLSAEVSVEDLADRLEAFASQPTKE